MIKCAKCGKPLEGVSCVVPWRCEACSEEKGDILHVVRGSRVRFLEGKSGGVAARILAERYLVPNDIYVVDELQIGEWSSHIKLQGMKPVWFNAVMFEVVQ